MSNIKPDFWKETGGGAFALAPMEDVTDTVFREVVLSESSPGNLHLLFTEFTSVDGICHPVGRNSVIHRLHVNESEREYLNKLNVKLIAQVWGNDPEKFFNAARYISQEYNFDGIDINMGCPVGKVIKHNSCSALIDQPTLALEIIDATIQGAQMPVSVKTRTGIREHETGRWIGQLLQSGVSGITLHARTQKMLSLYPAEWEQVAIAVEVRNSLRPEVRIFGNGDVLSRMQGIELMNQTGADGIMVGRGIFSNPWFFSSLASSIRITDRLDLLEKHIVLFTDTWDELRNFSILKRFFKIYINGFAGAVGLRAALMETNTAIESLRLIQRFRESLNAA